MPRDLARAFAWALKAAEAGDVEAQNNVATAYRNGDGVARDSASAERWYLRAGSGGDPEALANLARLFVDEERWGAAEQWLLVVARDRDRYTPAARAQMDTLRRRVEEHLQPSDRRSAEDEARRWLTAHPPR